jgi:hypothetical protein
MLVQDFFPTRTLVEIVAGPVGRTFKVNDGFRCWQRFLQNRRWQFR